MMLRNLLVKIFVICLALLLSGCNYFQDSGIGDSPATLPPLATEVQYQQCAFTWATDPLPDLSRQVQQTMLDHHLRGIEVIAEAYGENCLDGDTGDVLYFAALETDFRITVQVESLNDRQDLGNVLEEILIVLDAFPPGATPGPNPGYIGVSFTNGVDDLRLWFTVTEGESARALGLQGEKLLDELEKK
jgi:predicted small secreted protein